MDTLAVVLEQPERLALRRLGLTAPAADDVVVQVDYSAQPIARATAEQAALALADRAVWEVK